MKEANILGNKYYAGHQIPTRDYRRCIISKISLYLTIHQVEPKVFPTMRISLFVRPLEFLYNLIGIIEFVARYLMVFLLFFAVRDVSAQGLNGNALADSLADKLELYGHKTQSPILFIHFDKNIYTNNENVWFTAYFLHLSDKKAYKVLSVALVRDDDHLMAFNEKFMVNNGLAFGNTVIPDTTAAGNYSFIAYGNRLLNGKPDVLFTQSITIKRNAQSGYVASLSPLDTLLAHTQQKVMLTVINNEVNKKAPKTEVSYYLGNSAHPLMKGDVKITPVGQYVFDIPSAMLRQGENRLHVRVRQADEVKDLNIDLPAQPAPAVVGFFPEGGNLVSGLKNVVAWEVKSRAGQGLAAGAILYEDKTIIDTIHTNSYGLGRFSLTPKANTVYRVKLLGLNKRDTLYNLPAAVSHIPVMSVPAAVAGNLLSIEFYTDKPQLVYLNLHNYARLFSSTPIGLDIGEKKISVLLDDMPKGLTQATITDSLGRPLAERLFFAHYDKRPALQIRTDKASYKSKEKITLSLKLDNASFPDSGLVSIACIQENRLSVNNKNDIESYFYLKSQLDDLPVRESYMGTGKADNSFLEDILLIKGWRRYTWLDMLKTTPADTMDKSGDLIFKGLVTRYGSKIREPVEVVNASAPLQLIPTDSAGNFTLEAEKLLVHRNKKLRFMINNDGKQQYQVELIDPYLATSEKLIKELVFPDQNLPQQPNTQLLEMTGMERAINLKDVKITSKKDNLSYGQVALPGPNACGDYVCTANVLNCAQDRDRPDNRQPIEGKTYKFDGHTIVYNGCHVQLKKQDVLSPGIYAAQEFYPSDLSQPNSPPEYISTLYWKHIAKVSSSGTAEFSFYSNDITGRFKIVVQGLTTKDMVYGEQMFEVAKTK